MEDIKVCIDSCVDEMMDHAWETSLDIHAHPEVAFEEVRTSGIVRRELEAAGFAVEAPWEGLPTALVGTYSTGEGPTVALLSEIDALPGIGHACGHNIIAMSGVVAGAALARAMEEHGLAGTVRVYATPAEEDGGGKIRMLEAGAFEGVDAAVMMHPTTAKTRVAGACASEAYTHIAFHGRSAQSQSHPDQGINAMDAMVFFSTGIGLARQQLPDDMHISLFVEHVANDGVSIPDLATMEVDVSTLTVKNLNLGINTIRRVAEGCAHACGCTLDFSSEYGYLGRVPNETIGAIMRAETEAVGEPVQDGLPSDQGGEDFGNVTCVIPGVQLFQTLLPERKVSGHTEEFKQLACSDAGRHALEVSAKVLARTAAELMANPDVIAAAKAELAERMAC